MRSTVTRTIETDFWTFSIRCYLVHACCGYRCFFLVPGVGVGVVAALLPVMLVMVLSAVCALGLYDRFGSTVFVLVISFVLVCLVHSWCCCCCCCVDLVRPILHTEIRSLLVKQPLNLTTQSLQRCRAHRSGVVSRVARKLFDTACTTIHGVNNCQYYFGGS